ncbi:MAG: alpha/beta hydrolase [Chloroflexota bacterium]|nr:alpha/beta hydrolase [Chloroflexota bacterium]
MNNEGLLAYTAVIPRGHSKEAEIRGIILLHGYGSHMGDLAGLAQMIGDNKYTFFCPNAPIQMDVGYGQKGYSWYAMDQTGGTSRVDEALVYLDATLGEITDRYEIDRSELVIGGFSQGGMLAIHAGVASGRSLKGIISMSARLVSESEIQSSQTPVFISHGSNDQVVSVSEGRKARDVLENSGHLVTYREYPMAHEINSACMKDLNTWLNALFEGNQS